ncbi:MAG TPA: ABC transporter family substrate-binding protein [Pseudonocardia sp.]|nr:ABC transporter family substrate-binding protein [Pseudonocardia sp.]
MNRRLVAVLAVGALALAGCGGGGAVSAPSQAVGYTDINPQPRDNVRDGGDLRWPIDSLPNNYNYNEVDGTIQDGLSIANAVMPSLFTATADGGERPDPDYLTSADLTSTSPEVVTYTLNPRATWSDGTPITWRDLEASWRSQNGTDPDYEVSGTSGYDSIASVARGRDDKQAVVTFRTPFAEWQGLFSPLYPASLTGTPTGFNTAYQSTIPITAGPFTLDSIDQTAKSVTLKRDPHWWGTPAKLDHIIFKAYDRSAMADALANNEIDFYQIGSDLDLLRRAQGSPGVAVRNAPGRQFWEIALNGAPGSVLADLPVRQAIAQSINRQDITNRMIGQIVPNAQPDGNHLYLPNTKDYRDNSDALPYDPAHAEQLLESAGWARRGFGPGAFRTKNGQRLSLRMIYYNAGSNLDIVKSVQNQLAQVGVDVVPQQYQGNEFDTNLTKGNFDLVTFGWGGTTTPLSSAVGIYASPLGDNPRQNFGRVASPQIDALFQQGMAELDDTKRAEIGNEADRLIWQQAHSVVLYARPGTVAARANLANFGATGLADIDYINAGFVK